MAGRAAAVLRPAGCARLRGEEAAGEPPQAALTDEDLERTVFARGCVLIDASDPETPLYAKNPDAPIIPASTTKIMTCILAIEMAGDLSAAVAVPDEAARLGGSNSRMGLVRGESLPMRDLLYGLMLVSANDAARAIACHLAGSAEDFAALMNGKAAALGMEDTRFAAPSGVYRSGYTSTAYDMARLMAYAMRNRTFRQIVSAAEYTVPANGVRRHELHLVNSNRLISDPGTSSYYYEYAIGGKTGTTTVGGKCLVAVAERDGAVLIASLMGARDEKRSRGWLENRCFADAKGLFERAYELLYAPVTAEALGCAQVRLDARAENACPSDAGQGRLALVADLWGRTAFMRRTDIEAVRSGAAQLSLEPSPDAARVEAPVFEGEAFGTLNVTLRGRTLFSAPLLASRSVEAYEPAAAHARGGRAGGAGRIRGDGPRIAVSCGRRLRGGLRPASAAPPQERGMNCCAAACAARFFADFLSGRSEFFALATAGCAKLLVSGAAYPV